MVKTAHLGDFLAEAGDLRALLTGGDHEEWLLEFGVVEQLVRSAGVPLTEALARGRQWTLSGWSTRVLIRSSATATK
jgi:hypothetical protein